MLRFILAVAVLAVTTVVGQAEEVLYNGIELPEQRPQRPEALARDKPKSF